MVGANPTAILRQRRDLGQNLFAALGVRPNLRTDRTDVAQPGGGRNVRDILLLQPERTRYPSRQHSDGLEVLVESTIGHADHGVQRLNGAFDARAARCDLLPNQFLGARPQRLESPQYFAAILIAGYARGKRRRGPIDEVHYLLGCGSSHFAANPIRYCPAVETNYIVTDDRS